MHTPHPIQLFENDFKCDGFNFFLKGMNNTEISQGYDLQ